MNSQIIELKIKQTHWSFDEAIELNENLRASREYYAKSETDRRRRMHEENNVKKYWQCTGGKFFKDLNTFYVVETDDGLNLFNQLDYISSLTDSKFSQVLICQFNHNKRPVNSIYILPQRYTRQEAIKLTREDSRRVFTKL